MAHKLGMAPAQPDVRDPYLTVGPLVLDNQARVLIGPAGRCELPVGVFAVLRALMKCPGVALETGQLIAERWCADLEPAHAETAIRMCISRARDALGEVGGDPKQLRSVNGVGYRIDGEPRIVRAYTPGQAAALERLIATHPDTDLAASLVSA